MFHAAGFTASIAGFQLAIALLDRAINSKHL